MPGIASFAAALEEQQNKFDDEVGMMKEEREIFEDKLKNSLEVVIVGAVSYTHLTLPTKA